MEKRLTREHAQLLLTVARMYYEQGLNQEQIASLVAFSRSGVSRLLTEAKDRGMVQFHVGHPIERQMALEQELTQRFGLRVIRVVDSSDPAALPSAGAAVLVNALRTATVLACSAGTTVAAMVDQLPRMAYRDLTVVQMIGSLERSNPLEDASEVTRRIAERFGADHRQLPAPLIVANPALAKGLRHEQAVANALALAAHADVALLGIGALDPAGHPGQIFRGWLSKADVERLVARGAVGHMCGQFFDDQGVPLMGEIQERVMAVPLGRLSGVRTVMGIAAGMEKVAAIRGALHGGFLHILVTDVTAAEELLRRETAHTH